MQLKTQDPEDIDYLLTSIDAIISERSLHFEDEPFFKSLIIYYLRQSRGSIKIDKDDLYTLMVEIEQVDNAVSSLMTVGGYGFIKRESFNTLVYDYHLKLYAINMDDTKVIRDTAKGLYSQELYQNLKILFTPEGSLNDRANRAFDELSEFIYRHAYNYFYSPRSNKDPYAAIYIEQMAQTATQNALVLLVKQDRLDKINHPNCFLAYAKTTVQRECWKLKPLAKKPKNIGKLDKETPSSQNHKDEENPNAIETAHGDVEMDDWENVSDAAQNIEAHFDIICADRKQLSVVFKYLSRREQSIILLDYIFRLGKGNEEIKIAAEEHTEFKNWLLTELTYKTFAQRLGITPEDAISLGEKALASLKPQKTLNYEIAIIRFYCLLEQRYRETNKGDKIITFFTQTIEEIKAMGVDGYVMDDHLIALFLKIKYQNVQVIRARANAELSLYLHEIFDLEN